MSDTTVKFASIPENLTDVVGVKCEPVMVIKVPIAPWEGAIAVIAGGGNRIMSVSLTTVPCEVVTVIGPVVAPLGTVEVSVFDPSELKLAVTPLKATASTLLRLSPVIVTSVPLPPVEGLKEVIMGEPTTKLDALVATETELVTVMGPLMGFAGTYAHISVDEMTANCVVMPPMATDCTSKKLFPVIVIWVPGGPEVGANSLILGSTLMTVTGLAKKLNTGLFRCPMKECSAKATSSWLLTWSL